MTLKTNSENFKESFRHFANGMVIAASSHWSFVIFFSVIIIWLCVGLWVGFPESWQLILHISLSIVTFLMVLLIQHIQLRETCSMQIKLDELLKGVEGSRNAFINIQTKPDHHLDKLQNESKEIALKEQDPTMDNASQNECNQNESESEIISKTIAKIKLFGMSD